MCFFHSSQTMIILDGRVWFTIWLATWSTCPTLFHKADATCCKRCYSELLVKRKGWELGAQGNLDTQNCISRKLKTETLLKTRKRPIWVGWPSYHTTSTWYYVWLWLLPFVAGSRTKACLCCYAYSNTACIVQVPCMYCETSTSCYIDYLLFTLLQVLCTQLQPEYGVYL